MRRFTTRWSGEVVCQIDMLLALAVILLALFVLASPPRPEAAENAEPPGTLIVQLFWPDEVDCDIDLWLMAPGEQRAVGYSNQNGRTLNLLRDDLGFTNDASGQNFEIAYSRTLPAGQYVANVHSYSARGVVFPLKVRVSVQQRRPGSATITLATVDLTLERVGQETTAVRFRLDERGTLVPGSVNDLPTPLRNAS